MKTSSEHLWKLIRSLNPGERLFFKRNFTETRHAGNSVYLKLFDAIAAQKKYDEEAIIRKFSPAISKTNIAAQKHYLQKQLCDALLICDTREKESDEIYRDIQLIRVYRKKGLLDEAHILWKKTVLKARKTESFALLNILKSEFSKMVLFSGNQTRYDELHSLFKGNIITYNEYTSMISLRDIYTETLLLKRKAHFDIDETLKDRIRKLLELVSTHDKGFETSFWFRHYLQMNKATLLYLLDELPEAFTLVKKAWEDWKEHPEYLNNDSEYYIELLYMINYIGINKGDFNYVEGVFNHELNNKIGKNQRGHFEAIKFLALNKIYNKTVRYKEVEKLVAHMKQQYGNWESMLNADLNRTLNLSLGIACFVLEQYNDALFFTKRGLLYFKDGTREEQGSVAHLLLLLITYNMDNTKLFDAQYRAAYNYFYKRKKKHDFESVIVRCLHRSFYMKNNKEKLAFFEHSLSLLEKSRKDKVQQMAFQIFNYPAWLMAKCRRMNYREYVTQEYKTRNIQFEWA